MSMASMKSSGTTAAPTTIGNRRIELENLLRRTDNRVVPLELDKSVNTGQLLSNFGNMALQGLGAMGKVSPKFGNFTSTLMNTPISKEGFLNLSNMWKESLLNTFKNAKAAFPTQATGTSATATLPGATTQTPYSVVELGFNDMVLKSPELAIRLETRGLINSPTLGSTIGNPTIKATTDLATKGGLSSLERGILGTTQQAALATQATAQTASNIAEPAVSMLALNGSNATGLLSAQGAQEIAQAANAATESAAQLGTKAATEVAGKAATNVASKAASAGAGTLGQWLGGVGIALAAEEGIRNALSTANGGAEKAQALQVASLSFGVGDREQLQQLIANALYMDNVSQDFYKRSAGLIAANVATATAGGALSGLQVAGPWGLLAGLGTGLATGLAEIGGAAKARKTADLVNRQINTANQAVANHLSEAFRSTSEAENFAKMQAIAAEGGKLYKKGSILDVDETSLEELKKQGYKIKILQ